MAIDGRGPIVLELVELMDGHQFHTVDTQLLQVGYLLNDTCKRTLMLHTRTSSAREVANMHLIDDEVVDRRFQW